ncbi:hypothetical protein KEH51_10080 [[Brevibacterium] frigoritolerans]|uniref:Uncharacterized protein n=1 Tax=Peribacillus frigoritolerans TaxID=450367 RepID=A0A941FJQ5_9BACI|nr:hypothetical protein [Peribacillus frigoritolerans]
MGLPILLTGSILILFHSAINIERLYTTMDIWSWMGTTFILEALIFSVAVLLEWLRDYQPFKEC